MRRRRRERRGKKKAGGHESREKGRVAASFGDPGPCHVCRAERERAVCLKKTAHKHKTVLPPPL